MVITIDYREREREGEREREREREREIIYPEMSPLVQTATEWPLAMQRFVALFTTYQDQRRTKRRSSRDSNTVVTWKIGCYI